MVSPVMSPSSSQALRRSVATKSTGMPISMEERACSTCSLRLFHEADVAHVTDHGAVVLFYATAVDEFLHPFGENCRAFAFFSTDAFDSRKNFRVL